MCQAIRMQIVSYGMKHECDVYNTGSFHMNFRVILVAQKCVNKLT